VGRKGKFFFFSFSLSPFHAVQVALCGEALLTTGMWYRFGWVNASYVVGLTYLDPYMRRALEALTPWETYKKAAKDKTASQPPPK